MSQFQTLRDQPLILCGGGVMSPLPQSRNIHIGKGVGEL